jgi:acetyl-CoA acetyltransferase
MRDVAIVSFAQLTSPRSEHDEVEMLVPVIAEAIEKSGVPKKEIGFTVSGSCDYLGGRPFSFVMALDALGAWPPISESHVEMDGAWALYEAWVRLQHGDVDSALVYAFGRSSQGDLGDVLVSQLDPYYLAPLAPDWVSLAALQARALLDASRGTERDMARVAARSRRDAGGDGGHASDSELSEMARAAYVVEPLRAHDCPTSVDGVAAVVLVAGDLARKTSARPAWIRGIDHRIEAHSLGVRDLTRSPSTALAAQKAGAIGRAFDVAEIHAPFSHQEIILREALGLGGLDSKAKTSVNPSGGALAKNPFMVGGLNRIGEAATRVIDGRARTALAHATSGPCLQQNLVCVLEASP